MVSEALLALKSTTNFVLTAAKCLQERCELEVLIKIVMLFGQYERSVPELSDLIEFTEFLMSSTELKEVYINIKIQTISFKIRLLVGF